MATIVKYITIESALTNFVTSISYTKDYLNNNPIVKEVIDYLVDHYYLYDKNSLLKQSIKLNEDNDDLQYKLYCIKVLNESFCLGLEQDDEIYNNKIYNNDYNFEKKEDIITNMKLQQKFESTDTYNPDINIDLYAPNTKKEQSKLPLIKNKETITGGNLEENQKIIYDNSNNFELYYDNTGYTKISYKMFDKNNCSSNFYNIQIDDIKNDFNYNTSKDAYILNYTYILNTKEVKIDIDKNKLKYDQSKIKFRDISNLLYLKIDSKYCLLQDTKFNEKFDFYTFYYKNDEQQYNNYIRLKYSPKDKKYYKCTFNIFSEKLQPTTDSYTLEDKIYLKLNDKFYKIKLLSLETNKNKLKISIQLKSIYINYLFTNINEIIVPSMIAHLSLHTCIELLNEGSVSSILNMDITENSNANHLKIIYFLLYDDLKLYQMQFKITTEDNKYIDDINVNNTSFLKNILSKYNHSISDDSSNIDKIVLKCDESNNIYLCINNYHKYYLKYTFKNNNNIIDSNSMDIINNDLKTQNLIDNLKKVIFNYNNYSNYLNINYCRYILSNNNDNIKYLFSNLNRDIIIKLYEYNFTPIINVYFLSIKQDINKNITDYDLNLALYNLKQNDIFQNMKPFNTDGKLKFNDIYNQQIMPFLNYLNVDEHVNIMIFFIKMFNNSIINEMNIKTYFNKYKMNFITNPYLSYNFKITDFTCNNIINFFKLIRDYLIITNHIENIKNNSTFEFKQIDNDIVYKDLNYIDLLYIENSPLIKYDKNIKTNIPDFNNYNELLLLQFIKNINYKLEDKINLYNYDLVQLIHNAFNTYKEKEYFPINTYLNNQINKRIDAIIKAADDFLKDYKDINEIEQNFNRIKQSINDLLKQLNKIELQFIIQNLEEQLEKIKLLLSNLQSKYKEINYINNLNANITEYINKINITLEELKELREKELKEKELKDKELEEKVLEELREKELKEKKIREKELKERKIREKELRELRKRNVIQQKYIPKLSRPSYFGQRGGNNNFNSNNISLKQLYNTYYMKYYY